MEDPHGVPAAGPLVDQLAHQVERLDGRIVRRLGVGGAKFARRRREGQRGRNSGGQGKAAGNPRAEQDFPVHSDD